MQDLVQRGYEDAYRLFVEPVVGGAPPVRARDLVEEAKKASRWSSEARSPRVFGLSNDSLMTVGLSASGVYFAGAPGARPHGLLAVPHGARARPS